MAPPHSATERLGSATFTVYPDGGVTADVRHAPADPVIRYAGTMQDVEERVLPQGLHPRSRYYLHPQEVAVLRRLYAGLTDPGA